MATSDCLLLNVHAKFVSTRHVDHTTASDTTSNNHIIEVSLRPSCPPLPSDLLVHCPGLHPGAFTVVPRIVRAVGELLLLRVTIRYQANYSSPEDCDYFIYRADAKNGPSLQLLSRPDPFFHDDEVGLLGRGEHYTVAVLSSTHAPDVYDLRLLHSETPDTWSFLKVSVAEPQKDFPVEIPSNCHRLLYHDTTTVITIGGKSGTMGWVDLWRGILLCDVLCEQPTLRGIPLPLPVNFMKGNNGNGFELGCPKSLRGISVFKDKSGIHCLKFVHLEANATQLPEDDEETGSRSFLMCNWAITTWTNCKMTSSWKDWDEGPRVQASEIIMDSHLNSELLASGLLLNKTQDSDGAERALQNLMVSDPAPGIVAADDGVIYLMARVKFLHPKAWVLAIDTNSNTLRNAAEFGSERQPGARVLCCPSSISNYMNPESHSPGCNLRMHVEEPWT